MRFLSLPRSQRSLVYSLTIIASENKSKGNAKVGEGGTFVMMSRSLRGERVPAVTFTKRIKQNFII